MKVKHESILYKNTKQNNNFMLSLFNYSFNKHKNKMTTFENHDKSLISKSFDIINKIRETSSINQKIEILKSISNQVSIDLKIFLF